MYDLNKLLHKEIILKNGIEGIVVGFCQYDKKDSVQFLIEYWTKEGKSSGWYSGKEFKEKGL